MRRWCWWWWWWWKEERGEEGGRQEKVGEDGWTVRRGEGGEKEEVMEDARRRGRRGAGRATLTMSAAADGERGREGDVGRKRGTGNHFVSSRGMVLLQMETEEPNEQVTESGSEKKELRQKYEQ